MQLAKPLFTVGSILIAGYNAITEQSSEGYLIICDKRLTGRRARAARARSQSSQWPAEKPSNKLPNKAIGFMQCLHV